MQTPLYSAAEMPTTACSTSDVAWPAIIGGAFSAVALTLILSPLGAALGFASASPWHMSESGKALTMASAIWLIIVQWFSSGLGGYLTGRLRTKWAGAHTHEVFFRDTVHGFLAWALATIAGALLLMSAASHLAGYSMQATHPEGGMSPNAYFTDSLFRNDKADAQITDQDRSEAARILATSMASGGNPAENDKAYLSHLVAMRTSLTEPEAERRVDDVLMQEKVKMDEARKAAAVTSLFVTLSLLIGAFIACVAGACGGHHRDLHYATGSLDENRLV